MSDTAPGEILLPRHCRVSLSADRKQLGLTFESEGRAPVTVVLPVAGAAGLQRKIAQSLYILGAKPAAQPQSPEAAPAPGEG